MNSFIKTVFAVVVGLFVAHLIAIFFIFGLIGAVVEEFMGTEDAVEVQKHTILELDLSTRMVDKVEEDPFKRLNYQTLKMRDLDDDLYSVLKAIAYAEDDENIDGLYIKADGLSMSLNTAQELREALESFKQSGKFVYAYASSYDQFPYYVASVADSVFMHPKGDVMFRGLASQNFYLKDALAKFGVEPQIIRHGKYKAAVEPFMENEMSSANREQTMTYLSSIWEYTLEAIAKARNYTSEKLNSIANEKIIYLAQDAREARFVDALYYRDQMDSLLRVRTMQDEDEELRTMTVGSYAQYVKGNEALDLDAKKIALVYADGEINDGSNDEEIAGDRYAEIFADLRKDESIKAVVLRVNSPGGSAFASEVMWRELVRLREKKPLIVSMGEYAASGGYYISAPANDIVANPLTLTGSIGVFGMYMTYGKFLQEKLAVHPQVVKTNEHADFGSVFRPLDEYERKAILTSIEDTYSTFLQRVASGRKRTEEDIDAVGQGRVWSGLDALKIGLADTLGGMNCAIELAAKRAEIEDNYRVVIYPREEENPVNWIVSNVLNTKALLAKKFFGLTEEEQALADQIEYLTRKRGIRAEMPYSILVR